MIIYRVFETYDIIQCNYALIYTNTLCKHFCNKSTYNIFIQCRYYSVLYDKNVCH